MSGWKNMNYPHKLLMLTMIIFFPLLQAQTQNEEELPTLELLWFISDPDVI